MIISLFHVLLSYAMSLSVSPCSKIKILFPKWDNLKLYYQINSMVDSKSSSTRSFSTNRPSYPSRLKYFKVLTFQQNAQIELSVLLSGKTNDSYHQWFGKASGKTLGQLTHFTSMQTLHWLQHRQSSTYAVSLYARFMNIFHMTH